MAQGLVKKPSSKPKSTSSSSGVTKRGSRQINPKKSSLIKQAKINRKFTSGLTAQTERMLGERAGHLEMLGKGRKKGGEGAVKGGSGSGKKSAVKK